jgi:hypothetical protein
VLYKDLDERTKELVKFADFLTRLVVIAKSNYLALMQAFPDKQIKKNCFVFSYDKLGYILTYYKPSGVLGYQLKLFRTTAKTEFRTNSKNYQNTANLTVNVNSRMKGKSYELQFAEGDGNGGWLFEELDPITDLCWLGELYNDLTWFGRTYDSEEALLELIQKSYYPLAKQLGFSRIEYNASLRVVAKKLRCLS